MFNHQEFISASPFPHIIKDNFIDDEFALELQSEIINSSQSNFDRYDNPFEKKWTFRDKNNFPTKCKEIFDYFNSNEFISELSILAGITLIKDPTKNFWGIHKYDIGDKLDIHVDAGMHPSTKLKKELTLGLYLSKNWKEEYGCDLELWRGDNSKNNDAKIYECVHKISPIFNRLVLFKCDDYAWHGNPHPTQNSKDSMRIFLTISYLSNRTDFENKRQKAFFVKLPDEPENEEKDKLRLLRADPDKYKEIYRTNDSITLM